MKRLLVTMMLFFCASQGIGEETPNVSLQLVKYDVLAKKIAENRGKVVLVDLWNSICLPCIRSFPHLVEMHKKYADKGLVVVSVALDDPTSAEAKQTLEARLKEKGAVFTNYWLNEPAELWQQKLHVVGFPAVYIFDRDGKWTLYRAQDGPVEDDVVERKVIELLDKK